MKINLWLLIFVYATDALILFLLISSKIGRKVSYRVVYYKPTGRTIGILISDKTLRFYYYINDLELRIGDMNKELFEDSLKRIKKAVEEKYISCNEFTDLFFEDIYYVTDCTPIIVSNGYNTARDLLAAYQNSKLDM